ncbi:hypothetical protein SAMN03159376_02518 [Pseudomonas sp. NFACC09-4]|uniref:hypothetical protein n=1 Tax=Pseudomonas TaxID=286 RepID=UPI000909059E|nr:MULTISPECIES: hypothetical protein [Pseudomonas]MDT8906541.1 hypothetical protein [Pseudomonas prosekii]NHN67066.1 hypothetical protein [Pseudomonas fluorescens]ROO33117.1 hypothetical protein BIV08_07560 [Pseudomonas sp. AF76]SFW62114.1 hypothetical protein SAMN03159376_02518 [Pseudomonas sp. NFACC09-4]
MQVIDFQGTPVKKVRHQLLYLIYGDKQVYRHEAKFSILTALSHGQSSTMPHIRILTDRPEDYLGWPVETLALTPQLLSEWQGNNGYIHRRKACAIAAGLKLAHKTLFVDTDTLFLAHPGSLFQQIQPGQNLMDSFEYHWDQVCERETYLRLGNCLRAHGVSRGNGFKLYNSGLCGVSDNDASLLEQAIERIDEWTEGGFDIHTIEQIAISFTLRNQTIRKTDRHVYHYFGHKQFFHTMHAHFFAQHGETFDAQLIERSRDVPRSRPLPPIWRRLKIKWQLRNQRGAFYRIGRDLLYGSEAPQNPYFNLCRHHWWDSASREINRLEPERRKKSFGQLEQWPQQMPAPSRAQDKSLILAQLNRQVTPSA